MKHKLILSLVSFVLTVRSAPPQSSKFNDHIPSPERDSFEEHFEGQRLDDGREVVIGRNCTAGVADESASYGKTVETVLLVFAIVGIACTACALLDCLCACWQVICKDKRRRRETPETGRELKTKPGGNNVADEGLFRLVQAMVTLGAFLMAAKKQEVEQKKSKEVFVKPSKLISWDKKKTTQPVVESKETLV